VSPNSTKILIIEDNEADARLIREYLLDASRREEDDISGTTFDLTWKKNRFLAISSG